MDVGKEASESTQANLLPTALSGTIELEVRQL
jgi:hypothetical protein